MKFTDQKDFFYDPGLFSRLDTQTALKIYREYVHRHGPQKDGVRSRSVRRVMAVALDTASGAGARPSVPARVRVRARMHPSGGEKWRGRPEFYPHGHPTPEYRTRVSLCRTGVDRRWTPGSAL